MCEGKLFTLTWLNEGADDEKTVLKGGKVRKISKKIDRKLKYCKRWREQRASRITADD